jgi:dihydrodipicolinate synthase/N-acetylneuraminate lyase
MLKKGFFTALGTPLDASGRIIVSSLKKQIARQIEVGASGVFLFGTMGMGGCIRECEYETGIKAAIEAVGGKCILLVSAQDNSLQRVADRMAIINKYDAIDGVVLTAPYYFKTSEANLITFFVKTAAMTKKDYYLYDHEPITKHKLNLGMMNKLIESAPNIKGVKSGDILLVKQLAEKGNDAFTPIFSGSDLFDVANNSGIKRYLDGIFACMPVSVAKLQECFNKNDVTGANVQLRKMMGVRDVMIAYGIWPTFTYAMNLLGFEGNHAPDYEPKVTEEGKKATEEGLRMLGEL